MPDLHSPMSECQETYLLQALADVRKLIYHKLGSSHRHAGEDLAQRVFCKLWAWRGKREVVLGSGEWRSLAKRVVTTEIAEYFSEKYTKDIVFSQGTTDLRETIAAKHSVADCVEGNTHAETRSLLAAIWKAGGSLSLRQRYAFVLQTGNFLIEFISAGICRKGCLAQYFELSKEEFTELLGFYPLSDEQIIELFAAKSGAEITTQQLWEARAKAKAKLARELGAMLGYRAQDNDRKLFNTRSARPSRAANSARAKSR